jgi:hypothetical protein
MKRNDSQYADAVKENNNYLPSSTAEARDHIFGTIKRQWGYNHTNLTGLEKMENTA